LYHHALVKLIILHKMEKSNQTWEESSTQNNFEGNESSSEYLVEDKNHVNPELNIIGIGDKREQVGEGVWSTKKGSNMKKNTKQIPVQSEEKIPQDYAI
jgi:hypothetical protein